jgi:hypothetical protein
MSREDGKGNCSNCDKDFSYYLIHNGFNDSSYAYCDLCGETCLLNLWTLPAEVEIKDYGVIPEEAEAKLKACKCGGTFRKGAAPRCPHCSSNLSATEAAQYLEANAPGTKSGWRWQRTWEGLYCIVIEERLSNDCWRT